MPNFDIKPKSSLNHFGKALVRNSKIKAQQGFHRPDLYINRGQNEEISSLG